MKSVEPCKADRDMEKKEMAAQTAELTSILMTGWYAPLTVTKSALTPLV